MAAQFSVDFAVFRPFFPESGSGDHSHPNPLGLSPIATATYLRNGLYQTHGTYIPYCQQFSYEKGPVFGKRVVASPCSSQLSRTPEDVTVTSRDDGLGNALEQSGKVDWNLWDTRRDSRSPPNSTAAGLRPRPLGPSGVAALTCFDSAGGLILNP